MRDECAFHRGDIYFADLGDGIGSEQCGYRPVIIVQNDIGNKYSPTIVIAPITSKQSSKTRLPTHCYIKAGNALKVSSVVLLEQLRTIDKKRIGRFIGKIDKKYMREIDTALALSVGLSDPTCSSINEEESSSCSKMK